MDIRFTLDPALEVVLGRSNDLNNGNTGQNLTVEEFVLLEINNSLTSRHKDFWKQRDADAIISKIAPIADQLTDQEKSALDQIINAHAVAVEGPIDAGGILEG